MAILTIPDEHRHIEHLADIQHYLLERGIELQQYPIPASLNNLEQSDPSVLLDLIQQELQPYMTTHGYQQADIVSISPATPNLPGIRKQFREEHTHQEDEVRYFLTGQGFFWFNLDNTPVFYVTCQPSDLLNVPAGVCHWFELEEEPCVRVVRLFSNTAGWVPHYTQSGISERYQPLSASQY
jgi:1,2-dihydroxy-3-keto-5-methylthiopentene dioxygenase